MGHSRAKGAKAIYHRTIEDESFPNRQQYRAAVSANLKAMKYVFNSLKQQERDARPKQNRQDSPCHRHRVMKKLGLGRHKNGRSPYLSSLLPNRVIHNALQLKRKTKRKAAHAARKVNR